MSGKKAIESIRFTPIGFAKLGVVEQFFTDITVVYEDGGTEHNHFMADKRTAVCLAIDGFIQGVADTCSDRNFIVIAPNGKYFRGYRLAAVSLLVQQPFSQPSAKPIQEARP